MNKPLLVSSCQASFVPVCIPVSDAGSPSHHSRERPVQLPHFSDSLAVTSDVAVVWSSMCTRGRPRLELFVSTSAMLASILCPTLQWKVGPLNLDSSPALWLVVRVHQWL